MREFLKLLEILRWDDHRYYHQSRINQMLQLMSAISIALYWRAPIALMHGELLNPIVAVD